MDTSDAYLTLSGTASGYYKDRGSKFLSFAYPVDNEDDVKSHLDDLKKAYHDARHFCYAFMIGADQSLYRAADDGEPGNSAGAPILGQIRSRSLTNVLVVVVRYFGGTKLGVPGLIAAYKTAAAEALDAVDVVETYLAQSLSLRFGYPEMDLVMKVAKSYDLATDQLFYEAENCRMVLTVRESLLAEIHGKLEKIEGLEVVQGD